MTQQDNQSRAHHGVPARWISGLVPIAVGTIFLLNNMHIVRFHDIFVYWPAILIVVGVSMLASRLNGPRRERS